MNEKRTVAVTGTPGTGKSTISRKISELWGYRLVDLNSVIEEESIYENDQNGTKLVDPEELEAVVKNRISNIEKDLVLDGHLSHLLSSDIISHIVVLRTNPTVLKQRLESRGYPEAKLQENLEAEAVGVIIGEVLDTHYPERVYEVDTTELGVEEVVERLEKAFAGSDIFNPKPIDWLSEYAELRGI